MFLTNRNPLTESNGDGFNLVYGNIILAIGLMIKQMALFPDIGWYPGQPVKGLYKSSKRNQWHVPFDQTKIKWAYYYPIYRIVISVWRVNQYVCWRHAAIQQKWKICCLCLNIFNKYESASGAKINFDKTKELCLRRLKE